MGCVATKTAAHATPAFNSSGASGSLGSSGEFAPSSSLWNRPQLGSYEFGDRSESGESGKRSSSGNSSVSFRMWNLNRQVEGEQVAAGWPAWLSSVAGEAIQGWVPLKADSFEKLEKIGQGTYSSVFRAREIDTGRIVALKKVRFDNFEPESVRFMAREIQILRRLDHPNIIKLEGLITSRLSSTIYLVFEYMEHDLAGLSSCPDIKLTEPQIKCYMHQLFTGLEQCHSHGIIHRDIKCANLLVNNNGTLKIADFGLANIWSPEEKQQLTSRVVTLWYRPPELLLGSTHYEPSVDLWSAGCVFAELFTGKPVLQGRTEVEQIHKILKLCGSPPEEFWKNSRLPHATVFKLQQPHGTTLQETFGYLPNSAFKLLETLLSIDPNHRGTASSALASEYFRTKPYACDPSSLPKYQPNKEIDVKLRAGSHRRSISGKSHVIEAKRRPSISQKSSRDSNNLIKTASHREARNAEGMNRSSRKQELPVTADTRTADLQPKSNIALGDEGRRFKQISRRDHTFSGPLHEPSSSASFVWAKKPKEGLSRIKSSATPRSRQDKSGTLDLSNTSHAKSIFKWSEERNEDRGHSAYSNLNGPVPYESIKDAMLKQWMYPELQESVYTFGVFHSRDMSEGIHVQDTETSDTKRLGYQELGEKVEFSGPLLQPHKVDKFLERHEQRIRKAVRKSWFQRGQRQGH